MLVLSNSVAVIAIAWILQNIIYPISRKAAKFYIVGRTLESLLLGFSACFQYMYGWNGKVFYQIAMISLAFGSLPLLTAMLRSRIVPTWLGYAGLFGYTCLGFAVLVSNFVPPSIELYAMLPGACFEITFAFYLILYGLNDTYNVLEE